MLTSTGQKNLIKGELNPYKELLLKTANEYIKKFIGVLPEGSSIEIGGSLRSGTLTVRIPHDVDLRVLIPSKHCTPSKIHNISEALAEIVPFDEIEFVDKSKLQGEPFVLKHMALLDVKEVEGKVKLDVTVHRKEGFVEYAKFIQTLPPELVREYVSFKILAGSDEKLYKKVKIQFYAMIR